MKIMTLFLKLPFYAGKLSDVLYVSLYQGQAVGALSAIGSGELISDCPVYTKLHPSGWGDVLPCLAIVI